MNYLAVHLFLIMWEEEDMIASRPSLGVCYKSMTKKY